MYVQGAAGEMRIIIFFANDSFKDKIISFEPVVLISFHALIHLESLFAITAL
jgi:hypothetical protein